MRSALLCVFFTIIIQVERLRAQSDDFRPTPIPLNEWHPKRRESRGEQHETIQTDYPNSAALVPVHYWEDALRHSVYLTLVRDKIDQLITKGDGKSSNIKTTSSESKEIDDHDLWNKIKSAPFNRVPEVEPADVGDVTVLAKGRLLENKQGFTFAEDERSKENCSDDKCLQGVKAFWSVKRVRQRDHDISQGKYHYELTFSVISQTPKKQKKSHENPIRTFTVRESFPKGIIDKPQEYRKIERISTRRPERALWFHKNIAPVKQIGRRQFLQGFDKIFTTLFSGDDTRDYDAPPTKYKVGPNGFPPGQQYPKIGHLGGPTDQHQIPYPYRQNQNKQIRPPLSVPPINPVSQTYFDIGQTPTANSNLYSLYPYAHRDINNGIKTTRPAVLPTPLPPIMPQRDYSAEVTHPISSENLDNMTIVPDFMKYQSSLYNKYKPIPVKVNYFPENVRPPVYNAPPGIFVTMDKKPFKPLPPLKYLHLSKPHRPNRPIDFRPSPQVMDVLFADPDAFSDTAFKPITVGYADTNTTNDIELTDSLKKSENKTRKTTINGKKTVKKHENIKRVSTAAPEIITAQSLTLEEMETLEWANILGAFTKTTPMVSQTELVVIPETTTPMTTTITTVLPKKRIPTTTEAVREITSTTLAPKKRTRPPQKLVKQEKIKKHKRITTTTSSTTTTTNAPENIKRRTHDLTPQASSAATGTTKSLRESHNKTSSNTTATTSTTTTTTTTITTTTPAPTTTTPKKNITSTTQPKNKNRFRQSTLMLKGTSVKHDRWTSGVKTQSNATIAPTSSSYRRKGSNFQGYMVSTTRIPDEGRGYNHADRKPTTASTDASIAKMTTTSQTQSLYEETVDQYEANSILPLRQVHEHDTIYDEDTKEAKDNSEYPLQTSSSVENQNIEKSQPLIKLSSTSLAQPKNKTKCKKKKQNIVTVEEPNFDPDSETLQEPITLVPATARTSADISTGNDILDELLNFNFDSDEETLNNTSKTKDQEEENSKSDEFEDILGVLQGITQKPVDESQYDDDDDGEDDENESEENYGGGNMLSIDDSSAFGDSEADDEGDEKESARDSDDDESPHDRPFSFLELMTMS